ncbi:Dhp1-interacting protein Din1 [Blumeria hordei DH14]|uniref:Decapping nuclease n=1 Tax=Blumeria graminis f. sp. hordei (strain DH14) TaxID=546991 RepID=N1JAX5_BLUG1|nr:Dhp1-interacting protein Din1 [Blumeria hordei DH14]
MTARNVFQINPISRFGNKNVTMKRPKEFTCFSYNDQHQFIPDDSSLKYYYPPTIGADLSQGFDKFQKFDESSDGHLDSILKAIIDYEKKSDRRIESDFVTWRGMMTKVESSFIEENHIYKLQSQSKQFDTATHPGRPSQEMMTGGYKFETLCLLPQPWNETSREYIENRENETVNNFEQYCSIVRTALGNTTIILGGEVDGSIFHLFALLFHTLKSIVWDFKPTDCDKPINWVELKTSVEIQSRKDFINYERKLMKFWIQSFLLGVPKIIVGFRTPDGILTRIEEIATDSIPRMVKTRGHSTWDGNVCLNFAAEFLRFIRETITEKGVWRIRRQAFSHEIEVFQVSETGFDGILSDDFISWRSRITGNKNKIVYRA